MKQCLLDLVLEPANLSVLFQPIIESRLSGWSLHSLECLTRGPRNTNLEHANFLFEYARRKRKESAMDRACVARALRVAAGIATDASLSLNVHASTLGHDRGFPSYLADMAYENSIPTSNLLVEIVEHTPFWDGGVFLNTLTELRRLGVQIALDDIGIKHSNFRMVLDSQPDFFKIDRYLVEGCSTDYHRRSILESISDLARKFGSRVIAEGVTSDADLIVVQACGINLVQGHLFYPALREADLLRSGVLAGRRLTRVAGSVATTVGGDWRADF